MKFAWNLLSVSPLLIVGLVALVVVGIAVIAIVLVHTHKVSKKTKQTSVEQQQETAAEPVAEEAVQEPVTEEVVEEAAVQPAQEETVAEPVAEEIVQEPVAEEVVEEVAEQPAPAPAPAPVKRVVRTQSADTVNIRVSYNRSFAAKIIQADDVLKNYYSDIKNELLSYKKVRARMSWRHETFRQGRKLLAKFTVRGKTLSVYYALDPKKYADTKYKIIDVSHIARNALVPTVYKIRNERRRRYAKQLIADLMAEHNIAAGAKSEVDFAAQYPYETTEALLDKNLIKLVPWRGFASGTEVGVISVKEEEITQEIEQAIVPEEIELPAEQEGIEEVAEEIAEEPVAEEVIEEVTEEPVIEETVEEVAEEPVVEEVVEEVAEEPATEETVEEVVEVAQPQGVSEVKTEGVVRIRVRYNRSFTAKLIQADETLKNYYEIIKNELLKYKKVKSRISWRQETFRRGRKLLARMQIRGKTLSVYFALNPADYAGTKYKVKDVSDIARNAEVPTLYKIKNDRRCRYAKQLIADLMKANEVLAGEEQNVDYVSQYPYEEIEPLIDRKLVKLVPWKEIVAGSEVGVITVNEEDITEEIAMASEQPVENDYVEPVEDEYVEEVEDDYVEESVRNFFDETEETE
ncbi:MAG: hypothetical protein K2L12_05180 [Clostridia bacterium]|nr:hypothetical protein [Clostridia bacterium]